MTKTTLGDHVKWGSPDDQTRALTELGSQLRAQVARLQGSQARNDTRMARERLLITAADCVDMVTVESIDAPVPVLALATRNLFEIGLRARYIQQSHDNLKAWMSEALLDRIQLHESLLTLKGPEHLAQVLRNAVAHDRKLAEKHGLVLGRKPMSTAEVAEKVGMREEYTALFKLFSKLLHPSSYYVNASQDEVGSLTIRNVLLVHIQLYGHDLVGRAEQWIAGAA
jgi:hypothetical protein